MEGGVIFFDPLSMLVFPFFLSFMALPLACSTTKHMVPSMNNACYPTINITKHFDIFYATFFFFHPQNNSTAGKEIFMTMSVGEGLVVVVVVL